MAQNTRSNLIFITIVLALTAAAGFFFIPRDDNQLASKTSEDSKRNVILIVIDTLRADHLGYHGYERDTSPTLDKFAGENLYFKRAISAASWTPPSMASIFSGMYGSVHGHMPLRSETAYGKRNTKLDDSFVTLAEEFKRSGYATAAIIANPLVSERFGFAQGFDNFYCPGARERGDKVNRRVRKYLSDLRPPNKPFFLYIHYMDPHDPYEAPDPYSTMFQGALKSRTYPEKQVQLMAAYDGEIRYVDEKINELFNWLRDQGLYQNSIIAITSDHGEQFLERGYQGHADKVYQEEVHVPLILKAPGLKGKVDTPVSLVDLFPTLLEVAGVNFSHPVHGYSLISQLEQRKNEGVLAEVIRHHNQKAYLDPSGKKLVLDYPMERGLVLSEFQNSNSELVFDINGDPFEISPLSDDPLLKRLRSEYIELYLRVLKLKEGHVVGETELDEETLEQLKSLGYL